MKVLDCSIIYVSLDILKNVQSIAIILLNVEVKHAIDLPTKVLEHSMHTVYNRSPQRNVHFIRVLQ